MTQDVTPELLDEAADALDAERAETARLRESREEVFEEFKRYTEAYRAERALADALAAALDELTKHGEHEGRCQSYPGQNEDFDGYDSCYLHIAASNDRQRNALNALVAYRSARAGLTT